MLWRGIAIGIIISAPMGPVGILCVQRTLEKGRSTGFFTGIGAAISDLFYCLITGFGLSFIEDFLKANQNVIQIIGSVVLVIFGIYLFRSNPAKSLKKPDSQQVSKRKNILGGFLFTFSNPLIIFLIIGLFARFNFLLPEIQFYHYIIGFVAIFIGALIWWWLVTLFVDKVRTHFNLRSMWLINKIIGAIVMIFALVGVVTAVTGMANAANHVRYYNSSRGFVEMEIDGYRSGGPLVIENVTSDTVYRFLPLDRAEDFVFTFRLANLNNEAGKTYSYVAPDGKGHRVAHPGWRVVVKGRDGRKSGIGFATSDNVYDELLLSGVMLTPIGATGISSGSEGYPRRGDDKPNNVRFVTNDIDFFTGENAFRLSKSGNEMWLSGGDRDYNPLAVIECDIDADSIGIGVAPGGKVSVDYIKLETRHLPEHLELSHLGSVDALDTYLAHSTDEMEGEWEVFDRSFDENFLRPGGQYRVAVVEKGKSGVRRGESEAGYDMIYLGGAVKRADEWQTGRLKGELLPTSFKGVYDVKWYDPAGYPLEGEIKAQLESKRMLTLQFADRNSTMRLRRVR